MSFADEAMRANAIHAADFHTGDRPAPPSRRVAVLTCMDARVMPEHALGIGPGEAHVLRNAGGRVTDDVVRSLLVSTAILGTREAAVVHHTDCGLLGATNDELRARVASSSGASADDVDFLPFGDADAAVLEDVGAIVGDPRLTFERVSGFLYDVRTGRLRAVPAD